MNHPRLTRCAIDPLFVSIGSLRTRSLPQPLGWLGVIVGVAGLLSIVPPLSATAHVFGLFSIAWFAWLGIVMIRTADGSVALITTAPQPMGATTSS